MFRLSEPVPSQKTPLFPKPQNVPEKVEEKKVVKVVEKKKVTEDEKTYIPVIFRSIKQADLFSIPSGYQVRVLEDLSESTSPKISQIYEDITKAMEMYGQWNAHLYSAAANVIMNTPYSPEDGDTVTTPIFMKNELMGQGMLRGIPYISVAITMTNLSTNHHYLVKLGSRQPWRDYSIVMKNEGDDGIDLSGKVINVDIPIEYVSFDEYLNYMYIYIPGLNSSMRKLKVGETFREK